MESSNNNNMDKYESDGATPPKVQRTESAEYIFQNSGFSTFNMDTPVPSTTDLPSMFANNGQTNGAAAASPQAPQGPTTSTAMILQPTKNSTQIDQQRQREKSNVDLPAGFNASHAGH